MDNDTNNLHADIGVLIKSCTELKNYFEKVRDEIEAERKAITERVAEKEKQIDRFLQEAMPEIRYVQDITIGGSKDFFYPVWFQFPRNSHGVGRITFCRDYEWNQDTNPFNLNNDISHQAALLLELEGNAYQWLGDVRYLEIKRFYEVYNPTVSHVSYEGYCKWEKTGTHGDGPQHVVRPYCPRLSTVYLRGGGIRYRIIKNWKGDVQFSDTHNRVNLTSHEAYGTWYVEPIPFAERIAPKLTVNAFVDPA